MAIAITLQEYLNDSGVEYEVLPHSPTSTSRSSARAANIPADQFVKPVVLEDEDGYLMVLIPSTHHLELGRVSRQMNRRLGLATEKELTQLFSDCDVGAIPPIGAAYGMNVLIDDDLTRLSDVYFEAGDHTDVVHLKGKDFQKMMGTAVHGKFSSPM